MLRRLAHHWRRSQADLIVAVISVLLCSYGERMLTLVSRSRFRVRGVEGRHEFIFSFNFGAVGDDRRGVAGPHTVSAAVVRAQTVIGADGPPGADCFTEFCHGGNGGGGEPVSSDGNWPPRSAEVVAPAATQL